MLQLNPPLTLITPKGKADAHVLIDPGQESHLYWVVFLPSGECWTFRNPEVRLADNPTEGRPPIKSDAGFEQYHHDVGIGDLR